MVFGVGRQPSGVASNSARLLVEQLAARGALAVGVFATGNIKVPRVEWGTLRQAMENQMNEIQKRAAENARTGLLRQQVSTGRLSRAVASPKNVKLVSRGGKPVGFAVGLTGYLDSDASQVKYYWRAIEEGSAKMVGRKLFGTWGAGIPSYGQGGRTAYPPPVMAGPPYGVDVRGGKFLPRGWYDAAGVTEDEPAEGYTIDVAIKPHRYYRRAWQQTNTPARMEAALLDWAKRNGLPLTITGQAAAGRSVRLDEILRIRGE